MLRVLKAFFPAVVITYILAALLATQVVLQDLVAMGVAVDIGTRVHASLHDLLGLATSYLLLILFAFLLAMPAAAALVRLHLIPGPRALWFALAGALALVLLHVIMRQVLGVWPLAAAREWPGLLLQGLAGGIGGYVYARLSQQRPRRPLR